MQADRPLFQPYNLGKLELKNRIVMAPLTRNRASDDNGAANDLMAVYYSQRASAGLIISEASPISQQGTGYVDTPGICTPAHVEGWKKVTTAVNRAGGHIFIQLWHVGRISHTSLQANGGAPVAPSAIRAKASHIYLREGFAEVSEPRALQISEIPGLIDTYRQAALNAKAAGFNGVEIHAANGYLLEEFIKDGPNHRKDAYGGSIENRVRLTLEVVDAVVAAVPDMPVGIRISPTNTVNDSTDSDPQKVYNHLVEQLAQRKLCYLHVVEGQLRGGHDDKSFDYSFMRKSFRGVYIVNNGYDLKLAETAIAKRTADLIAFGRPFISNPDLPARLLSGAQLNEIDKDRLYGGGAKGYTDYPALNEKA